MQVEVARLEEGERRRERLAGERRHCSLDTAAAAVAADAHCWDRTAQAAGAAGAGRMKDGHIAGAAAGAGVDVDVGTAGFHWDMDSRTAGVVTVVGVLAGQSVAARCVGVAAGAGAGAVIAALARALAGIGGVAAAGPGCRMPRREASCRRAE